MLQATGDKFERPAVHAFLDSLMDLEHEIPGSCEVLIGRLLHRLGRLDITCSQYFRLENRPCSFSSHNCSCQQLKGVLVARPSGDGSFSFCKEVGTSLRTRKQQEIGKYTTIDCSCSEPTGKVPSYKVG
jgi:hypothetical protein